MSHPTPRRSRRRGYTLIELIVTLPIMALLLAGMAAAIGLSARGMPDGTTESSAALRAAAALDVMHGELGCATTITARSATSITFKKPDRNTHAPNISVRYQWSGTAGAPLLRSVNGSADERLLDHVHAFALSYSSTIDAVSGLPRLDMVSVRLVTPSAAARPLEANVITLNEPTLP